MSFEILLGILALLGSAVSGWLAFERQQLISSAQGQSDDLAQAREQLATLKRERDSLHERLKDSRMTQTALIRVTEECRLQRERLKQLSTHAEGLSVEHQRALTVLQRYQDDKKRDRILLDKLQRELEQSEQIFSALGVDPDRFAKTRAPLTGAERGASRMILTDLRVQTMAEAVTIANSRGFALLGVGESEQVTNIASRAVLIEQMRSSLERLMGDRLGMFSAATSSAGLHALPLAENWLMLQGEAVAPITAMRLHALRLIGVVETPPPPDALIPSLKAADGALAGLEGWRSQWGARAVSVLSIEDGEEISTSLMPGVRGLIQTWQALTERLSWTGWPAELVELQARSISELFFSIHRMPFSEAPIFAAVLSPHPLPLHALDELYAELRWQMLQRSLPLAGNQ